jgi:hypothetical protein
VANRSVVRICRAVLKYRSSQFVYALVTYAVAVLCVVTGAFARDGDKRRFRVGGLVFGDVYHVVSHHTDEGEGATGVVVRRGYLTFDGDFSDHWTARFRLELNQSGEFETYTFDLSAKDLYLGWRPGRQRIRFGLSPTPTFDLIESVWGLRYLVRTPMDLQGVASRDTGISAAGPINQSGSVEYRAMAGAGLEFGNESGDGRKWMGALTWRPAAPWLIDLYLDYEVLTGHADRSTFQIFTGYRTDSWRWGLQYSNQNRQDDPQLEIASVFAIRRLSDMTSVVGRVDRIMEPSPRGDNISYLPFDPGARATFFIGGLEFRPKQYLYITPNATVTTYDRNDQGEQPETDFHLRLTLFLDLEN